MLFEIELQHEESSKTIQRLLNDEVLPAVTRVEQLALNVTRYRVSFWRIFRRKNLAYLENEYREASRELLSLYYIYTNPDKLFADLKLEAEQDVEKIKILSEDYRLSRSTVMYHFDRGLGLIEMVQSQLDRYHRSADQRLAIFLSTFAITITIITLAIDINFLK